MIKEPVDRVVTPIPSLRNVSGSRETQYRPEFIISEKTDYRTEEIGSPIIKRISIESQFRIYEEPTLLNAKINLQSLRNQKNSNALSKKVVRDIGLQDHKVGTELRNHRRNDVLKELNRKESLKSKVIPVI